MIRVQLPAHLRRLANIGHEIELEIHGPATFAAALDELERCYPMLRGTLRDQTTHQRRAFIRFFACGEDWSHLPPDSPLPEPVAAGSEPLRIVGAMAGG